MTFRFQAKNVFATYPQSPTLTKELIVEFYRTIIPNLKYLLVAQENHADNDGIHFHVLAQSHRKIDTVNVRFFDIDTRHPNIQVAREPYDVMVYCKKDGDFFADGIEPVPKLNKKRVYDDALACTTSNEFLSHIRRNDPSNFVNNFERLQYFASVNYVPTIPEYIGDFEDFVVPDVLLEWYNENLARPRIRGRSRSLFLCSPSKWGKTEWARSLGTHMYFNGFVDWKRWNGDAKLIIFDDIEWKFVPNKKAFFGAQKETTINPKYGRVKTVEWGGVSIYLCNTMPNEFDGEGMWWRENVVDITLTDKLYV